MTLQFAPQSLMDELQTLRRQIKQLEKEIGRLADFEQVRILKEGLKEKVLSPERSKDELPEKADEGSYADDDPQSF